MQPDSRRLLTDMLAAARAIESFLAGKTLADLRADDLLRSAVYFKFAVVGETMAQVNRDDDLTVNSLSESARIIAFRNQVIHGYARIDDEITWRIVEQKLPILIGELEMLLAK